MRCLLHNQSRHGKAPLPCLLSLSPVLVFLLAYLSLYPFSCCTVYYSSMQREVDVQRRRPVPGRKHVASVSVFSGRPPWQRREDNGGADSNPRVLGIGGIDFFAALSAQQASSSPPFLLDWSPVGPLPAWLWPRVARGTTAAAADPSQLFICSAPPTAQ
jgi:hypothetical protein